MFVFCCFTKQQNLLQKLKIHIIKYVFLVWFMIFFILFCWQNPPYEEEISVKLLPAEKKKKIGDI